VVVVASLSQGRTAAAQCGLFIYKSVPVIFEPPCTLVYPYIAHIDTDILRLAVADKNQVPFEISMFTCHTSDNA